MSRPTGPWVLLAISLALATGVALAADPRDEGSAQINLSKLPPEVLEVYPVFAIRCSKCHTLARPLNAKLKGEEWNAYIRKMTRRPGSGISEQAGEQIFRFLTYYSEHPELRP